MSNDRKSELADIHKNVSKCLNTAIQILFARINVSNYWQAVIADFDTLAKKRNISEQELIKLRNLKNSKLKKATSDWHATVVALRTCSRNLSLLNEHIHKVRKTTRSTPFSEREKAIMSDIDSTYRLTLVYLAKAKTQKLS